MQAACEAGVSPLDFWHLTYREIYNLLKGTQKRYRRAMSIAVTQAYLTEAFARQKRMPNLTTLLHKIEPPRVMSPREQRNAILAMAQAMGAKVTYKKKEAA